MRAARYALAVALLGACSGTIEGPPDAALDAAQPTDAEQPTDATPPPDDAAGGPDASPPIDAGALDHDAALGDAGGDLDAGDPDVDPPGTWRSALFPRDWAPAHEGGAIDADGRFLPDFSSAGWHRGEARPPVGSGAPTEVVDAPRDGTGDATRAIQDAIDAACDAGGGIVLLPAGTYRVRLPSDSARAVIEIGCSRLVLRGEGPDRTRILVDDARRLRDRTVIRVRGPGSITEGSGTTALARDVLAPTRVLELASAPALSAGDWVVVRTDNTDGFRREHRMDAATSGESGLWPSSSFPGLVSIRRVVAVTGSRVELDAPIHDVLRTRDRARVYRVSGLLEEVGLESFALGMIENRTSAPTTDSASENDYQRSGTTGYEVHASRAIELDRVHDAWIHDVDSFLPAANERGVHLLSGGILLEEASARITIERCELAFPQYRGGGGNGYLFHFQGHDALVVDSRAQRARHGFIFNHSATGNVLLRATTVDNRYSDDAHRYLARSNLYDRVTLDRAWLQAVNRGTTSTGAGFTATRHVFWGTHVIANHTNADGCAVESAQWGHGYLIGSSAAPGASARLCPATFSNSTWARLDQGAPEDFVEGEGMGATLWPISLHAAQLAHRCASEGRSCVVW